MDVRDTIPEDAEEIEGIEKLSLVSVGIDIGSSTSHLTFSELTARRQGTGYSSQFVVTDKELTYRSDIVLTPYVEGNTIDVDWLDGFIADAYAAAGYTNEDVDTGAVIVTGEAAKKKNAERIANLFSEQAGKFVTASAGPTLEAIMAAHGSGAVELSERRNARVMNVDVGGGTSKVTTVEDGEVLDTASINVGARLVATDEAGVLERAEPTARTVAELAGLDLDLRVGQPLSAAGKEALAEVLADALLEFVTAERADYSPLVEEIAISHTDYRLDEVDVVTFSGGCSEFIYGEETADFGDLGPLLGPAVMERTEATGVPVERTRRGIRATVVGSTQYSVQISGNTIHTGGDVLPVRNSQVLAVEMTVDEGFDEVYPRVQEAVERFDLDDLDQAIALCFSVEGTVPTLETMATVAEVATTTWEEYDRDGPVVVFLDMDLAQSVGSHIEKRLSDGRGVVTVDGIDVGSLEYIDVGEPLQASGAVPVVVKSLVFGARPE